LFITLSLQEIYKDRKKFSKAVFEVASSDLVNMGISVVSYTLKDIRDEEVSESFHLFIDTVITGVLTYGRTHGVFQLFVSSFAVYAATGMHCFSVQLGDLEAQEAQLPQRDRVTRYVSKFVLYFTTYGRSEGSKQQK